MALNVIKAIPEPMRWNLIDALAGIGVKARTYSKDDPPTLASESGPTAVLAAVANLVDVTEKLFDCANAAAAESVSVSQGMVAALNALDAQRLREEAILNTALIRERTRREAEQRAGPSMIGGVFSGAIAVLAAKKVIESAVRDGVAKALKGRK